MRTKFLFSFNATQRDHVQESENIEVKYEPSTPWGCCIRKNDTPMTKELLQEAVELMHSAKPKNHDIQIRTKELAENVSLLPESVTSVVYWDSHINRSSDWKKNAGEEMAAQSKKSCIEFLKELPRHVTKVEINTGKKWKDAGEVIKAIPAHVTYFKVNAEVIENCTFDELFKFFSSFPKQMQEIHLLGDVCNNNLAIGDRALRNLIIKLPLSVKTLSVPSGNCSVFNHKEEKQINLDDYRKKEYFPESYVELTNSSTEDLFQKAKNLLNDYTKNTSDFPGFTLFATFHWRRHHVDAVNQILKDSNSLDDLLVRLSQIETQKDFNPTGSLARRIHYIKYIHQQEQQNMDEQPDKVNHLNIS
ncbi:DUF5617 domain-containing protein [Legionella anisa]|uniref:RavJ-like C-terminal domain-containing protein n=1 Tax=Legionella anisa TaxID=28082 RepID=A0AAX0WQ78_9GAMM|nr:DUF5617 domain-containing protein [Legionella anisa]AWN73142.1 hypothetical protein DLD14_04410 [Legionella anisa]KTC67423.1 Ankyrin repeats (3 copies) [Legionella anisa]MCW8423972.1 DUF5617 domain-containing protein [Legionella anisa]MCW8447494.1 DUF5617 domain-containing protein [Legionella anisa]PNL60260.1 hypothetical protein A6J39_003000 [Legionella anisa]